ncbi:MAG TPA: hypothetical protein VMU89_14505 [Thermomicrobiaceae bacterium]|nr:hypothetical protein [Thermomicrobiaceae bacterium]
MTPSNPSRPLDTPEGLAAALREQDLAEGEIRELAPVLARLAAWEAPIPAPADTAQLVSRLAPLLPAPSPIRAVARARPRGVGPRLRAEFGRVVLQATLFRPWFWLSSAAIVALGLGLLSATGVNRPLLLELLGPALSYLAVAAAGRAAPVGTLELELACPVSATQLTLTRLLIVLSYDVALGLLLSLAPGGGMLSLTLHWLAPLLLVSGVALLLSGRLGVHLAVGVATFGWVAGTVLMGSAGGLTGTAGLATGGRAVALALTGLVALAAAVASANVRARGQLRHG